MSVSERCRRFLTRNGYYLPFQLLIPLAFREHRTARRLAREALNRLSSHRDTEARDEYGRGAERYYMFLCWRYHNAAIHWWEALSVKKARTTP
jgi:hypothetical protein